MSLINDLLLNLEDRRGGQRHDSGVFAGLQAADAELARGNENVRPFFLIIPAAGLLALAAFYFWTQQGSVAAVDSPVAEASPAEEPVKEGDTVGVASLPERRLLKLDDSMSDLPSVRQLQSPPTVADAGEQLSAPKPPADNSPVRQLQNPLNVADDVEQLPASQPGAGEQPRLQAIQLRDAGEALNIQLQLSALSEYRSYLLAEPNRLVFDIQTTEFMPEAGELPAHEWIRQIRHRQRDGELRLVFDLAHPVEIVDEQWVNSDDSKLLTLQLRAAGNGPVAMNKKDGGQTTPRKTGEGSDEPAGQDAPAVISDRHMAVSASNQGRARVSTSTYQQALRYYERQDYQRAIQTIEMHLSDAPNDAQALKLHVMALLRTNQTERADRQLYDATRRLPQANELKRIYAQRLMQQDRHADAVAVLYESPPPVSEAPSYHALLAALLQQLGQHAESADLYQLLLKESPERGVWWMGLAISLEELERKGAALEAYQQALRRELSSELRRYISARISALSGAQNS